ncbi:hypothetical protein RA280_39475 [Cupriavidus sp. CV2]|uniref:hypothetical protein n=1 Tax=Cupriavidus ulmosensis TaxID=3065913 RepID=UPI00296ACE46|nr:hypothetical protein [Cupriavidus sp. CV2]MDW3687716.1 hypothetical protein [Cupriavidus sp. CV2]
MNVSATIDEQGAIIRLVTKTYARFLVLIFALVPAYLVAYLFFFQDPALFRLSVDSC